MDRKKTQLEPQQIPLQIEQGLLVQYPILRLIVEHPISFVAANNQQFCVDWLHFPRSELIVALQDVIAQIINVPTGGCVGWVKPHQALIPVCETLVKPAICYSIEIQQGGPTPNGFATVEGSVIQLLIGLFDEVSIESNDSEPVNIQHEVSEAAQMFANSAIDKFCKAHGKKLLPYSVKVQLPMRTVTCTGRIKNPFPSETKPAEEIHLIGRANKWDSDSHSVTIQPKIGKSINIIYDKEDPASPWRLIRGHLDEPTLLRITTEKSQINGMEFHRLRDAEVLQPPLDLDFD